MWHLGLIGLFALIIRHMLHDERHVGEYECEGDGDVAQFPVRPGGFGISCARYTRSGTAMAMKEYGPSDRQYMPGAGRAM